MTSDSHTRQKAVRLPRYVSPVCACGQEMMTLVDAGGERGKYRDSQRYQFCPTCDILPPKDAS